MQSHPIQSAKVITEYIDDFRPKVAIALGSGLGDFATHLSNPVTIPYEKLDGFPECSVAGHDGELILGTIGGVSVACLKGRVHLYEGSSLTHVKTMIRTFQLLGCEYWLSTNASGSLHEEMGPGELMMITDHINFQGTNPLIGPNQDEFGSRFFSMENGYDKAVQDGLLKAAKEQEIHLHQGVYIGVLGPNYETPAEIRAFRTLGADAVGMSTVSEILVANHCGMKVGAIATITNYACGIAKTPITHEETLHFAGQAAGNLSKVLVSYISSLQ